MKNFLYILAACMLCSCARELDLEYRDIDPIPVIEANLTDYGLDIRITMTSPMDEPMDTVALTDYVTTLSEIDEQTFRLEVDLADKHFVSDCAIQPKAEIADIKFQWISMPYDRVAVMTIYLNENKDEDDEYWWIRVWRNSDVFKWMYYSNKYAIDGKVEASTIVGRENPEPDNEDNLKNGDELRVSATRIPRHIFMYLESLSTHTIAGPTTFSGDFCLGYFLASTPVDTVITYSMEEF